MTKRATNEILNKFHWFIYLAFSFIKSFVIGIDNYIHFARIRMIHNRGSSLKKGTKIDREKRVRGRESKKREKKNFK